MSCDEGYTGRGKRKKLAVVKDKERGSSTSLQGWSRRRYSEGLRCFVMEDRHVFRESKGWQIYDEETCSHRDKRGGSGAIGT